MSVEMTRPATGICGETKFRQVSIFDLHESGMNETLYRPIREDDPEIQKLAESIRNSKGLIEPLVISKDGYIISGHRRRIASYIAGLTKVPCIVKPISSGSREFLRLLRESNRQRVKGYDEIIREGVADASGEEGKTYENLLLDRLERSEVDVEEMEIIGTKERAGIKGNRPLLDAAIKVISQLKEFWPLSDRAIHYRLLNDPPLKHINKPDSTYMNDRPSYQVLCNVLTRGRLTGEIPWESIEDETRPVALWKVHQNISLFIDKQFDGFMKGYFRDYMQSQPNHIEIVGEKLTIQSIIRPMAMDYRIPYTIGRGYSSINPRYDMAKRFEETGKDKLIVLILSDFDPDGEEIAQSFARSMRDDFEVNIFPVKVALTEDQVIKFKLPPSMRAKATSTNYKKFVENYGDDVFELEALPPKELQEILTEAIISVIDINSFNYEREQEKQERLLLGEHRKKVLEIMRSPNES